MRASRIRLLTPEQAAKRAKKRADAKRRLESRGRPVGRVEGTWVTDLAELKQLILLCWKCDPKFKDVAKKYGYFPKRSWNQRWGGVRTSCDGCRENGDRRKVYAHATLINKI